MTTFRWSAGFDMAQLNPQQAAELARKLANVANSVKSVEKSDSLEWDLDYSRRPTECTLRTSLVSSPGVTIQGLYLLGMAYPKERNKNLTFTLEYFPHGGSEKYILGKVAWNSNVIHYNGNLGPDEFRQTPMFNYWSNYTMNKFLDPKTIREQRLPIAYPMENFQTLDELLTFAGKALKINNVAAIPSPWDQVLTLTP